MTPELPCPCPNADASGSIGHTELQKALSNGGWRAFAMRTVVLLMNMFDGDRSGSIGVREFEALMGHLVAWKQGFLAADRDRSGSISWKELDAALRAMGYSLEPGTLAAVAAVYDKDQSGTIAFDEYIQVRSTPRSIAAATVHLVRCPMPRAERAVFY